MFFSSAFRSSFLLPDVLRPPRNCVMANWVGAAPRYSYAPYLPATTSLLCKCIIDRFCGCLRRVGRVSSIRYCVAAMFGTERDARVLLTSSAEVHTELI